MAPLQGAKPDQQEARIGARQRESEARRTVSLYLYSSSAPRCLFQEKRQRFLDWAGDSRNEKGRGSDQGVSLLQQVMQCPIKPRMVEREVRLQEALRQQALAVQHHR